MRIGSFHKVVVLACRQRIISVIGCRFVNNDILPRKRKLDHCCYQDGDLTPIVGDRYNVPKFVSFDYNAPSFVRFATTQK
jgi:hypothetical protein